MLRDDAWYGMNCFEGLSKKQQAKLIHTGVLSWGWQPEGRCQNPATVAIEMQDDVTPGPRFYCLPCALAYVEGQFIKEQNMAEQQQREDENARAPRL